MTSTSAAPAASLMSAVARSVSGSANVGRYSGLTCAAFTCSASSGRRHQSSVGALVAARAATVVPHEPAPITDTRIRMDVERRCRAGRP